MPCPLFHGAKIPTIGKHEKWCMVRYTCTTPFFVSAQQVASMVPGLPVERPAAHMVKGIPVARSEDLQPPGGRPAGVSAHRVALMVPGMAVERSKGLQPPGGRPVGSPLNRSPRWCQDCPLSGQLLTWSKECPLSGQRGCNGLAVARWGLRSSCCPDAARNSH